MSRPLLLRLLPLLSCLVWIPVWQASAQQISAPSLLDPEEMAVPVDDSDVYEDEPSAEEPAEEIVRPSRRKRGDRRSTALDGRASERPKAKETKAPEPEPPQPASRQPPAQILTPRVTDADLQAAWTRWLQAQAALDLEAARKAQEELLKLKEETAASDIEQFSLGFLRAADGRRKAQDEAGALRFVETAVALSPQLPYARMALAEAHLRRSPGAVGAYMKEVRAALTGVLKDPRYRLPALADLGAVLLVALLATAVVVVVALFIRRVRYFLHDFHHLFPRVTARWQSAALAVLLLSSAVVMRLGMVQVLLILLAAVAVYLTVAERAVAAVLLVLAALLPMAAGQLAQRTAFSGTVAEDVYVLERGGLRVRARHGEKRASFAELFALGRFEARRGLLEESLSHYKAAAALRSGHAALMTNMGNVLLATGDETGAAQLYVQATQADPSLPAPAFNLAEVYRRRAALAPDDQIIAENQKTRDALAAATHLDPNLLLWTRPPDERLLMNQPLLGAPLSAADYPSGLEDDGVGERVEAQFSRRLLGGRVGFTAWALPVLGAVLVFALGFASRALKASGECDKCGRPVCRRCDKELGVTSRMCAQCVNVFQRKGLVEARLRARKQIEVERHRRWSSGISYVLGGMVSGAGHLFAGWPLRGTLYAFLFLLAVAGVLLRSGVLRVPYGELPMYLKLAPLLLLLIPLHILSLRGLYRRQNE